MGHLRQLVYVAVYVMLQERLDVSSVVAARGHLDLGPAGWWARCVEVAIFSTFEADEVKPFILQWLRLSP